MFYLPPGSMMQLMDGRVLHKDTKTNLWHDNMGVPITEQQLHFMVSFPSFSADQSGGDTPAPTAAPAAPAGPSTSLSAPLTNILGSNIITEIRTNTVVVNTTNAIADIRAVFSAGTYGGNDCKLNAYVNGVLQTNVALDTRPGLEVPGDPTSVFACFDGDEVQFGVISPSEVNLLFDVTIQEHSGEVAVLDTFNVDVNFSVAGGGD